MTLLHVAYACNILVLVPVGLMALLGGQVGSRHVFQGKFPESEGTRTILGSLWTAILITFSIGLFHPLQMSPILILQVIYKSLWLMVFVVPRCLVGRGSKVPWGLAATFLVIVASYPWIIPWTLLFGPF